MNHSLLLLLSAHHLHAQLRVGEHITAQFDFTDSAADHLKLQVFLSAQRCPTYLLTDVIEEDFRLETIPYLTGKSRAALLQRKFEQFYRGTHFHQASVLQRHSDGRRDVDMLFSALTNPALLNPWLDVLWHSKTPLAGIYSVPHVSAPLIENHPSQHLLLISWSPISGLRESYFKNHQLQLSRLTPISHAMKFQDVVGNELARTYQYLSGLSLLPAEQVLDVMIVGHRDDLIALENNLSPSNEMRYEFVDITRVAQQLNINTPILDSDASQLFLQQLARARPHTQYGNAQHSHFYRLWRLRRACFWASGALFAASLAWATQTLVWQNTPDANAIAALQQGTQQIQTQTLQLRQRLPRSEVAPADLRASVLAMQQLQQHSRPPEAFLTPLSLVMTHYPNATLDELAWQMQIEPPATADVPLKAATYLVKLTGYLDHFAGNYRAAFEYLTQFQHALTAQGYLVTLTNQALDVSASSQLSAQNNGVPSHLTFTLNLVWTPPL